MKKVLVFGMFGGGNIGDEAVCRASTELCHSTFGDECDISILSTNVDVSKHMTGFSGEIYEYRFPRLRFWRGFFPFLKVLKSKDLVVIGGGGLFQDVHSPCLMGSSLFMIACSLLCKTPVVITALGVGPVRSRFLITIAKYILSHVSCICVRDEHSHQYLTEVIGVGVDRVVLAGDIVPLMPDFSEVETSSDGSAIFVFRDWPSLDRGGFVELVNEVSRKFRSIIFIAFEETDIPFYENFINKNVEWKKTVRIVRPSCIQSTLQLLASASEIYTMRLHGCIFAQMLGKNFVAFEYDEKVGEFCRLINKQGGVFGCDDILPNIHLCSAKYETNSSDYLTRCNRNRTALGVSEVAVSWDFYLFLSSFILMLWGIFIGFKQNITWRMGK
ncbi:MAG: polysaccharide pyruvyl transferase family protein [Pontiella sp.]